MAKTNPPGLAGLLLVAPSPPTPMPVPPSLGAAMLASYQLRDAMAPALATLAGSPLSEAARGQVMEIP